MNKIKVAKQLIRLAKSLIAYSDDDPIMKSNNVDEIQELINGNYNNVTLEQWSHICEICNPYAIRQVNQTKQIFGFPSHSDADDVISILKTHILNKVGKNELVIKSHLKGYLFGSIRYIIYNINKNKTDKYTAVIIDEEELKKFINQNSFEEARKQNLEQEWAQKQELVEKQLEKYNDKPLKKAVSWAYKVSDDFSILDLFKMRYQKNMSLRMISGEIDAPESSIKGFLRVTMQKIYDNIKEQMKQLKLSSSSTVDFIEELLSDKSFWEKFNQ